MKNFFDYQEKPEIKRGMQVIIKIGDKPAVAKLLRIIKSKNSALVQLENGQRAEYKMNEVFNFNEYFIDDCDNFGWRQFGRDDGDMGEGTMSSMDGILSLDASVFWGGMT